MVDVVCLVFLSNTSRVFDAFLQLNGSVNHLFPIAIYRGPSVESFQPENVGLPVATAGASIARQRSFPVQIVVMLFLLRIHGRVIPQINMPTTQVPIAD